MKDFKVYQVKGYLTSLVRDASDVRKYYDVASGDGVEFNSRNAWPIEKLFVSIIAKKTGTDFPYTITGWTGANIYHTGKNLLGGQAFVDAVTTALPNATVDTSVKYVQFASTTAVSSYITSAAGLDGKFKPNTQYTFILRIYKTAGAGSNLRVFYTDGTYDNIPGPSASQTRETVVLVTDGSKTVESLRKYNSSGSTRLYYDECGIFEGVLTASDFVAYNGTTKTYIFTDAGTVYGGMIDVTGGKLAVDKDADDLSGLTWTTEYTGSTNKTVSATLSSSAKIVSRDIDGIAEYYANNGHRSAISDFNDPDSLDVGFYCISDSSTTDVTTLYLVIPVNDSPSGKIVYTIPTADEYTLTPETITALVGVNNLWADCGDVMLMYRTN